MMEIPDALAGDTAQRMTACARSLATLTWGPADPSGGGLKQGASS
jgi:hypothetical protein